jgi:hypothetical protein
MRNILRRMGWKPRTLASNHCSRQNALGANGTLDAPSCSPAIDGCRNRGQSRRKGVGANAARCMGFADEHGEVDKMVDLCRHAWRLEEHVEVSIVLLSPLVET